MIAGRSIAVLISLGCSHIAPYYTDEVRKENEATRCNSSLNADLSSPLQAVTQWRAAGCKDGQAGVEAGHTELERIKGKEIGLLDEKVNQLWSGLT